MENFDPKWLEESRKEVKKALEQEIDSFDYFRDVGNYSSLDRFVDKVRIGFTENPSLLEETVSSQQNCHNLIDTLLRKAAQTGDETEIMSSILTSVYLAEEYLKRNPNDPIFYGVLAQIYFQRPFPKETALGFNLFRKAIDLEPRNHGFYEEMLRNFDTLGMLEDALNLLGKISEKDPKNPIPLFYRGWIYQTKLSDHPKAIEEYKRVMILDINFIAAQQAIEQILYPEK